LVTVLTMPAGGDAVLGHEGADLDVELVDEVGEEVRAEHAGGRVGDAQAVDDVVVLGRGGPGEADAVDVDAGPSGATVAT
jgi:hypothetical protein